MKLIDVIPNSPIQQYRASLIKSQNSYPLSRILSPEPHVRNRQINSMVAKYTENLEKQIAQNMQSFSSRCKGMLGKILKR